MLPDYHIHTPLCKHADGTPEEYRESAVQQNIPEICFTDHAPAPDGYDAENRMLPEQYPEYCAAIKQLKVDGLERIGFGIEADYYPAGVDFLRTWLAKQDFDLVLGSVHYIDGWAFDDPGQIHVWESRGTAEVWRQYFNLLGELAATRLFDVASHLDLPKKFGYRPPEPLVREVAAPALDAIKAAGMAIELNTGGLRKPVREIYPAPFLLAMARERDIPICFGSDAHAPSDVGYGFSAALKLARSAGYTHAVRWRSRRMIPYSLP